MKRQPKFWYCELWKMNYWYFVGWTQENFCKYISEYGSKYEVDPYRAGVCTSIVCKDGVRILIWVKKQPNTRMLGTLVHESIHAAHWTLDMRGVKADFNNDEPVAYLAESIFTNALG